MKLFKYRIYCNTDQKFEYLWKAEGESAPTTCPTNTSHSIDLTSITIVETIENTFKINSLGNVATEEQPRAGTRTTIISHNFCDPTTWYQKSVRAVGGDGYGEILTPANDGYQRYNSTHENWINVKHGKITGEDTLQSYAPVIRVNDTIKIEDIDYTTYYEDGYVVFNSPLNSTDTVKALHSYANGSTFTIAPLTGKKLRILYTEVQFGQSGVITHQNPIDFEVWGYNPYNLPNKMRYALESYKSVMDIINVSNEGTYLPKFGGMVEDIYVLPFKYAATTDISSASGMELRIKTKTDQPIEGLFGTMTAYCLSENE